MSININVDGVKRTLIGVFAGINGEKRKINKIYVKKNGITHLVWGKSFNINNKFYFCSYSPIEFFYSIDAINWQFLEINGFPEGATISSLDISSDGELVAVLSSSYGIYISRDAVNWEYMCSKPDTTPNSAYQSASSSHRRQYTSFQYINGIFVSFNVYWYLQSGNYKYVSDCKSSTDGINWIPMTGITTAYSNGTNSAGYVTGYTIPDFSNIQYINGVYGFTTQLGSGGTISSRYAFYYSNDCITWKCYSFSNSSSNLRKIETIFTVNNMMIDAYVTSVSSKYSLTLRYSDNGTTWNTTTVFEGVTTQPINLKILSMDKMYLLSYSISNNYYYCISNDLQTWTYITSEISSSLSSYISLDTAEHTLLIYKTNLNSVNCYYYDIKNNALVSTICTFPDDPNNNYGTISDIVYMNGCYFCYTNKNYICYSTNGINFYMCNINSENLVAIKNMFYIGNNMGR